MQSPCAVRHSRIGGGCDVCVSDSSADKTASGVVSLPVACLVLVPRHPQPSGRHTLGSVGTCLPVRVPLPPHLCPDNNASQTHGHSQRYASARGASPPSHGRRPQRPGRRARWRPGHPIQGGPRRAVGDSTCKRPHPEGPCPAAGSRRDPRPRLRGTCACAYGPGACAQCPRAL